MAFRGTFDYTLDAKNRLTVPARFRPQLADGAVLAKGVERCVAIYPPEAYEHQTRGALEGMNPLSRQAQELQRFFSANAHDSELDGAGRLMLPPFLIEHANLERDVVVTGAGDHLEVWDRAAWADYNADLTARMPDIAANLGHAA